MILQRFDIIKNIMEVSFKVLIDNFELVKKYVFFKFWQGWI